MAKIIVRASPGDTLYIQIQDGDGGLWDGSAIDATPTLAEVASYAVALSDAEDLGQYMADVPDLPVGTYDFIAYKQAGGSPDPSNDTYLGSVMASWDGTGFVSGFGSIAEELAQINAELDGAEIVTSGSVPPMGTDWLLKQWDDDSFDFTMPGAWDPDTYTAVVFTGKIDQEDGDAEALFVVRKNRAGGDDGLLVLAGESLPNGVTSSDASLAVVDEDTRLWRASFSASALGLLPPVTGIYWSIKLIKADGTSYTDSDLMGINGGILFNPTATIE